MRLSSKTRYGVRALFDLAYHFEGSPGCARTVSLRQDIPGRFLEQIFSDLKRAGIVISRRGPGGGYLLAKSADEITLAEVLLAIEGPVSFGRCLHRHDGELNPDEHVTGRCVTGSIWGELSEMLLAYMSSTTIADLCVRAKGLGIVQGRSPTPEENP